MDYRIWILPILLMLLIGGYYFIKKASILFPLKNKFQKRIYWGILYIVLTIILINRSSLLIWIFYVILFQLLFDFVRFLMKKSSKKEMIEKIYQKGIPIYILSFCIFIYGIYNASHPILKSYEVELPVKENYQIGLISDLHLGTIHGEKILDEVVEKANQSNFDLFIMAGDIFDEQTSKELKEKAYQALSNIKTKYGVYYVEGNHDLLNNEVKEGFLNQNVFVLSDEVVKINDDFYLVGRKDKRRSMLGTPRKELNELLSGISNETIVLVDHQPVDQDLASSLGVFLHLSGHTHAGQLFPLNFFMQYGENKKESYTSIVSSGYGAWGFPFRTAGHAEMVSIHITKKEN